MVTNTAASNTTALITTAASIAGRLKYPSTDPIYAQSFGPEAFRRSENRLSGVIKYEIIFWRVTGLVAEKWEKLYRPLCTFIQEKFPEWLTQRPRRQPNQRTGNDFPSYVLDCFLLGLDQGHASPHVVIISPEKWFRKIIGTRLTQSGLLWPDGFKCLGLPERIEAIAGNREGLEEFEALLKKKKFDVRKTSRKPSASIPAGVLHRSGRRDRSLARYKAPPWFRHFLNPYEATSQRGSIAQGSDGVTPISNSGYRLVLRKELKLVHGTFNGIGVEIREADQVLSEATLGGVVRHNGKVYAMTVWHAFLQKDETGASLVASEDGKSPEEDTIEFYDESVEDLEELFPDDPKGEFDEGKSWQTDRSHLQMNSRAAALQIAQEGNLGLIVPPENGLDWVLTKVPGWARNKTFASLDNSRSDNDLLIQTPLETKGATLVSVAILGLPQSMRPQPVRVAQPTSSIPEPGDCGSWAMSIRHGTYLGMVVAWCPSLRDTYLLNMEDIFEEVYQQTKVRPNFDDSRPLIYGDGPF
ncbi:uncharacterized protein PG998_013152 [Apiospora kogelbergensis]|uniref:uncharacterized protein n=1 Tax=Apiospora kogelbergensis TaxID=1337665 RepID=UPI0031306334